MTHRTQSLDAPAADGRTIGMSLQAPYVDPAERMAVRETLNELFPTEARALDSMELSAAIHHAGSLALGAMVRVYYRTRERAS